MADLETRQIVVLEDGWLQTQQSLQQIRVLGAMILLVNLNSIKHSSTELRACYQLLMNIVAIGLLSLMALTLVAIRPIRVRCFNISTFVPL